MIVSYFEIDWVEQMLATVMSSLGFRFSTAGWLGGIDFEPDNLAAPQLNGNNVSTVIWAHKNDGQFEFFITHAAWYLALTKAAPMASSVPYHFPIRDNVSPHYYTIHSQEPSLPLFTPKSDSVPDSCAKRKLDSDAVHHAG